mgnify:CR=1 FL=1
MYHDFELPVLRKCLTLSAHIMRFTAHTLHNKIRFRRNLQKLTLRQDQLKQQVIQIQFLDSTLA